MIEVLNCRSDGRSSAYAAVLVVEILVDLSRMVMMWSWTNVVASRGVAMEVVCCVRRLDWFRVAGIRAAGVWRV